MQNELNAIEKDEREIANIKYHLDNKHCISCANRDKKADFFIPECIVCLHPSNQEGKTNLSITVILVNIGNMKMMIKR